MSVKNGATSDGNFDYFYIPQNLEKPIVRVPFEAVLEEGAKYGISHSFITGDYIGYELSEAIVKNPKTEARKIKEPVMLQGVLETKELVEEMVAEAGAGEVEMKFNDSMARYELNVKVDQNEYRKLRRIFAGAGQVIDENRTNHYTEGDQEMLSQEKL